MSNFHPTNLFDKVFEGGILLKGLDGVLEFLGGVLLLFVTPERMQSFIAFLTHHELTEDPHDFLANLLVHSANGFGSGSRVFLILYLWIHAAIKLVAVIGILKNQLWAYPFSLITLGAFMLYQVYTIAFVSASLGMIVLTIFDAIILWLIWREYGKVRYKLESIRADTTQGT